MPAGRFRPPAKKTSPKRAGRKPLPPEITAGLEAGKIHIQHGPAAAHRYLARQNTHARAPAGARGPVQGSSPRLGVGGPSGVLAYKSGQRPTRATSETGHPGFVSRIAHEAIHDPLSALRDTTGIDVRRFEHPIRTYQTDRAKNAQGAALWKQYKAGKITQQQLFERVPKNIGIMPWGPKLGRVLGKLGLGEGAAATEATQVPRSMALSGLGGVEKQSAGEAAAQAVREALPEARKLRREQAVMYSAEKSARVSRATEAAQAVGGGLKGHFAAKGQLAGELPKTTFTRLRKGNISQEDMDSLFRQIDAHPKLGFYGRLNARDALLKAFEHNRTPAPHELDLLRTVFGTQGADALTQISKLRKIGLHAVDLLNIPRSAMASVDLSAPFRQGLVAGARHPVLFARAFKPMVKAFGSERVYQAVLDDLHARPNFERYQRARLSFTELGRNLTKREEQFISPTAEKIPLIHQSGRAYTAFLDKLRADVFDRQIELAKQQGVNIDSEKELRAIGKFVNASTGRGGLGPVEHWAPAMNAFFFSPRLIGSRISLLNPYWYARLTPFARKQAMISMVRLGSAAGVVLGGGAYLGAKVSTNPTSADFAKLRIANTRVDVLGGFQQYIRFGAQMASGKITSSTTGKTSTLGSGFGHLSREDIAKRFIVGKFAPVPSFVDDFFKGTTFAGQPFDVKKAVLQRVTPLVAQDAWDMYHNYDSVKLALLGYSISAFGIGMQTYGPQKPTGAKGPTRQPIGSGSPYLRTGGSGGSPYLRVGP